ncbi:hypothetical protein PDUR_08520 [Paenibacillus durus]|uniref:Uncharacterized protein n=1 Tax=Paenibacillus durus TaxID=44251 RepID=A0A089ISH7_PAEDU|nr:hypothetical protein PDUR_08520 [Paenibacillus durus]
MKWIKRSRESMQCEIWDSKERVLSAMTLQKTASIADFCTAKPCRREARRLILGAFAWFGGPSGKYDMLAIVYTKLEG